MIRKIGILGKLITSVPIIAVVWAGEYEIKYYAPKAVEVSIAGDFNGWNPDEFPMEKIEGGYFSKRLDLEQGVHEYKVIIDGEWLEGANLKYDTALRRTIITSNFAWSPKIFWRGKFLVNISSSGAESCHSLHGKITLNKNVSGMFLINSSGSDDRLKTSFEKLSIVYSKELFNLNAFYNLRVFQSPDPMRLLQRRLPAPLRQQEIIFYDETNPAEDFGLGMQGIFAEFGGGDIASAKLIVSDDYETEEDTLFASAALGGIRAEYLLRKGIDFPFASESHWFPDPDVAQTWFGSANALDWYKGFNEERELSIDASAEQGQAAYFGQCVLLNKMLHAVRWNEGGSGDAGIDKKWRFYEAKKYIAGVQYKGPVSA
ncbi:MAG: glycogen-binding domain-containing protein, partial [Elusimicrobiota bacterium]|nr:glycogen-binding domain-containing protein [Elusimicrobiota bacterium]